MKAMSLNKGPRFKAKQAHISIIPCPKSLNIIPNKIGTVENMKIEGMISLCFGIENSSVRMFVSNRQGILGIIVLFFVFFDTGIIGTSNSGSV